MAKEKRKKNLLNIFYITLFASSVLLFGFIVTDIVYNYIEHQNLIKKITDDFYLGSIGDDAQDGYYVVYAANDYILETNDGEIVIIYEMK